MDGFIQQLSRAEYCLLLPIYAAREEPIKGVNSQALAAAIIRAQVVHEFDLVARVKQTQASVILVVGAGDVGNFVSPLKEALS
jgi:UDP-N-acetylmuramate--alanine ligase